ncbi:hypothetical protein COCNU_scaffold001569G000060 [Cocos nucifera]|nr:hypothetical protein [Cocos nucifera]
MEMSVPLYHLSRTLLTHGAVRNEKLEEWRRAHPGERMRIVIPSGYVMRLIPHVCERLSFDIWDDCSEDSDMSSIPTGRRSFRYMGQLRHAYYNKASQSKLRLTMMHYGGSKSFAQYQYELRDIETGQLSKWIDVY